MFATRADLLTRINARRLAQLAVPADHEMPDDEQALRAAIEAGDPAAAPGFEETLRAALATLDKALSDASALLISYGIPAEIRTQLLVRLCCTVAIYYLYDAERMTDDVRRAYEAVLKLLDRWRAGELPGLVPSEPGELGGGAEIISGRRRYK
jgi:phage gp36-like protein